jgi:hypothetical protein
MRQGRLREAHVGGFMDTPGAIKPFCQRKLVGSPHLLRIDEQSDAVSLEKGAQVEVIVAPKNARHHSGEKTVNRLGVRRLAWFLVAF